MGLGEGVPRLACRPGATTSAQPRRPQRRHRWCAPAGMPGTATVGGPISYGMAWPTKITSIGSAACAVPPLIPGTLTKKSTHRVICARSRRRRWRNLRRPAR